MNLFICSVHVSETFADMSVSLSNTINTYLRNGDTQYDIVFVVSANDFTFCKDVPARTDAFEFEPAGTSIVKWRGVRVYTYAPVRVCDFSAETSAGVRALIHRVRSFVEMCCNRVAQIGTVHVVIAENRGYDIGKLVVALQFVYRTRKMYTYVTYVHTKTNARWRRDLLRVLRAHPAGVDTLISKKNKMVFCPRADPINASIISRATDAGLLCARPAGAPDMFVFCGGTMFTTRLRLLYNISSDLARLYTHMTSIDTDDIHWRACMLDSDIFERVCEYAKKHRYGVSIDADAPEVLAQGGYRNYIELCARGARRGIPDYQIEHAIERMIGFWITHARRVKYV